MGFFSGRSAAREAAARDDDTVAAAAREMAAEALEKGDEDAYWRHFNESAFAAESARITRERPSRWLW